VFGETRYAAKSWGRKRRVIMKAEVVQYPGRAPRRNPRVVVTNLARAPEAVYAIYRQRGDVENRHKELKDSLGLGRTSCPRFLANQGARAADGDGVHPVPDAAAACARHGLRQRPGRHAAGAPDQARGLDHPVGAPDRAAPAAGLSLARALAPTRAGGRRSGWLTAAPPGRTVRTTAGVVSSPSLTANGRTVCAPWRVLGVHWPASRPSTFRRSSDAIVVSTKTVRLTSCVRSRTSQARRARRSGATGGLRRDRDDASDGSHVPESSQQARGRSPTSARGRVATTCTSAATALQRRFCNGCAGLWHSDCSFIPEALELERRTQPCKLSLAS
jgi:Transposase DDE domain group 1